MLVLFFPREGRNSLFFVQLLDESSFIQFFNKARVDELFRLAFPHVGPCLRDIFIARFHALDVGVRRGDAVLGK
jgi:hypothetical protein